MQENQALAVERKAEAEKDREIALLNFVKALKEMEGLDLEHLEKLITLSHIVKNEESQMVEQTAQNQSPMNQNLQSLGQEQPVQ